MNRRRFLTTTLGVATIGLTGCLSTTRPTDQTTTTTPPETTTADDTVLTGYAVSDHVETPNVERTSDMDAWGLYIGARAVADEYFHDPADQGSVPHLKFIEDTHFDQGETLLYVQAFGPQTCYTIELDDDPSVSEDGVPTVPLSVVRTADKNEACGQAFTSVETLLRLSYASRAHVSDVVEVVVASHKESPEELELELETVVDLE